MKNKGYICSQLHQIIWHDEAKTDFCFWIKSDKLIIKRIESLIESIINHSTLQFLFYKYYNSNKNVIARRRKPRSNPFLVHFLDCFVDLTVSSQ
ncbi:MAG: type II toxin-antitoxin system YoeB family toxin [Rickettsia endosymbiont of Culicoides impunctatus]|nr:MAG: type II toxin-antitoxin system YoeB family toxin [Rickettsia endosymbiont of Culicoides impunctatus]